MRVLVVVNSRVVAGTLSAALRTETFVVELAHSGEDALDLLRHYEFDIALIDLALSDIDGNTLVARIRSAGHSTPLLALSSLPNARLRALFAGADDVVERDIDRAELVARIRAIIRRSRGYSQSLLQVGNLTLNVDTHDVIANGTRVHLTGKEFQILQLFVMRRNMILTKETILSHLYGGMDEPEIKIIDVFVCKLRSKLAKAGLRDVIGTVWGRGYTVRDGAGEGDRAPLRREITPTPTLVPALA